MSAVAAEPFHDRSNSSGRQYGSSSGSDPAPGRGIHRFSLYPIVRASNHSASDHSSIYNASVVPSSVDENAPDKPIAAVEPKRSWFGHRRIQPTSLTLPRTPPETAPPSTQPGVAENRPIMETRFSNNPNGTALTTIIERKSSISLRRTLRDISKRRSFTPVHTTTATLAPLADHEAASTLSLNEAAVHEFHKIFLKRSSDDVVQDSSSTANGGQCDGPDGAPPHTPVYPPFKRTSTPPGVPRWPGDLNPGDPSPRRSSLGFRRTLRSILNLSGDGQPPLPGVEGQHRRTSRVPRRVGQAYWRPPRSAQLVSSHSGTRHPFYSAPFASPVNTGLAESAQGHQPAADILPINTTIAFPSLSAVGTIRPVVGDDQPAGAPDWSRADRSMAGIVAELNRPTGSPIEERRDSVQEHGESSPMQAIHPTLLQDGMREQHIQLASATSETIPGPTIATKPPSAPDVPTPLTTGEHHRLPTDASSHPPQQKRISSAALSILLPIAEREGIVRPIRLVPVSQDELDRRSNGIARDPDSLYDERLQHQRLARAIEGADGAGAPAAVRSRWCAHRSPASAPTDRCWRCRTETGVRWLLGQCFCQPDDAVEETELESVRVVATPAAC